MFSRSVRLGLSLVLSGMLVEPWLRAAPGLNAAPEQREERPLVVVVLIDGVAGNTELSALISELLAARDVRVRFEEQAEFDPDQLLSEGADGHAVWVYLEVSGDRRAQLYFRGPAGRKFLLRELGLGRGLDAIGREQVAQVIESSSLALLQSSVGLDRAEARAAIARSRASEPTRDAAPPDGDAEPPQRRTSHRTEAWIAARYAAAWYGTDLGALHGPGVELGLGWRGPPFLRARVSGEWLLPRSFSVGQIEVSLQTTRLRALADVGVVEAARAHRLLLGVGGGLDLVRLEPRALDVGVAAAPRSTSSAPMLTAELRYEARSGPWALALALQVDWSLLETHYDLERAGSSTRLVTPWLVRPGALLALAWAPDP